MRQPTTPDIQWSLDVGPNKYVPANSYKLDAVRVHTVYQDGRIGIEIASSCYLRGSHADLRAFAMRLLEVVTVDDVERAAVQRLDVQRQPMTSGTAQ